MSFDKDGYFRTNRYARLGHWNPAPSLSPRNYRSILASYRLSEEVNTHKSCSKNWGNNIRRHSNNIKSKNWWSNWKNFIWLVGVKITGLSTLLAKKLQSSDTTIRLHNARSMGEFHRRSFLFRAWMDWVSNHLNTKHSAKNKSLYKSRGELSVSWIFNIPQNKLSQFKKFNQRSLTINSILWAYRLLLRANKINLSPDFMRLMTNKISCKP